MKKTLMILAAFLTLTLVSCQKDEPDTFCWECFEATMDTNGLPANVYRFDTCDLTFDEVEEMIGHKIGYISNHIDTIYKDCEVKR
jgi:hypothetical protein